MKRTVFSEMHRAFPDRITNKPHGIPPRRCLHQFNPGLSRLVTETIGEGWVDDLERISDLAAHADDAGFRAAFAEVKRQNKRNLAAVIRQRTGIEVDPGALFDVQIKRIHEYKRQLLNLLQTVALYNQIRDNPMADWLPRVKVFGGKAASSYAMAKLIIRSEEHTSELKSIMR